MSVMLLNSYALGSGSSPTYKAASTNTGSSSSVSATMPTHVSTDRLVMIVGIRGNRTLTTPSGWSLVCYFNNGTTSSDPAIYVFTKQTSGSEPTTSVTASGSTSWVVITRSYSQASVVEASSAASTGNANAGVHPSTTVTFGVDNIMWIYAHCALQSATQTSNPSNFSNHVAGIYTTASQVCVGTGDRSTAGTDTQSSTNAVYAGIARYVGVYVALT